MSIKLQSNRTILLAFGSAILVLIAVGLFSYRGIVESRGSNDLVEHTRDVLRKIRQLSLAVETMSSSLRGYVISGDEAYLQAMRTAEAAMKAERTEVRDMTKDNPEQQRRIAALDMLVAEWERLSDRIVAMRRDSGLEATIAAFRDARGELISK